MVSYYRNSLTRYQFQSKFRQFYCYACSVPANFYFPFLVPSPWTKYVSSIYGYILCFVTPCEPWIAEFYHSETIPVCSMMFHFLYENTQTTVFWVSRAFLSTESGLGWGSKQDSSWKLSKERLNLSIQNVKLFYKKAIYYLLRDCSP